MAKRYPPGSRFHPTDLGLVKLHLKEKVEKDNSGFIKTLNVYGDVPWRLEHDTNRLYNRNEWYYFDTRRVRGAKTVNRIVPRKGESLGGTWKSIGKKEDIMMNKGKELMGYKRELVFNKNVVGQIEKEKTEWHMTEYSLHKKGDEYHDLILCHIRLLHSDERFKPHVPAAAEVENNNNVLPQNQEQQQEVGLAMVEYDQGGDYVNQQQQVGFPMVEYQGGDYVNQQEEQDNVYYQNHDMRMMMMRDNDGGYFNQHHQQQLQQWQEQQVSLSLPPIPSYYDDNQGQYYQTDTVLHPINDYNLLKQCPFDDLAAYHGDLTGGYGLMQGQYHHHQQQLQQEENPRFLGAEYDMTSGFGLMEMFKKVSNVNQQRHDEQQQEDSPALPPLQQSNDDQQHYPLEDNGPTFNADELTKQILNDNNNNTFLPKQEQREEAGFANQKKMVVAKEHGDVRQQPQQQQQKDQEPSWESLGYNGPEDFLSKLNVEEELAAKEDGDVKQQEEEQKDSLSLLPSSPPTIQNSNNHQGQYPDDSITHNMDGSLTQQQLQKLERKIETWNLSF